MAVALRKAAHPSGKQLLFNPKFHSYSFDNVKFRSVSSVLNQFFPFDADRVAGIVAQKQGKSVPEVLAEWKMSATLGTNVHSHIEAMLKKEPAPKFSVVQGSEDKFLPIATRAVERLQQDYEVIAIETMIASAEYRLAGTIDFLARNRKTGAIMVGDWKTTSSQATGFMFGGFDSPCPGLMRHMANNKMSRYALQTLIYGHILLAEGYDKLLGSAIKDLPLEYGLVKFGPNQFGDIAAEFVRVQPSDIAAIDETAAAPETVIRRICLDDL